MRSVMHSLARSRIYSQTGSGIVAIAATNFPRDSASILGYFSLSQSSKLSGIASVHFCSGLAFAFGLLLLLFLLLFGFELGFHPIEVRLPDVLQEVVLLCCAFAIYPALHFGELQKRICGLVVLAVCGKALGQHE